MRPGRDAYTADPDYMARGPGVTADATRLANLDQLPGTGFTVACIPLKLIGGSAAPARVDRRRPAHLTSKSA